MRTIGRILVGCGLVMALAIGVSAIFTEAHARPCLCPDIYAPVVCDNGKVYPNQCVADCRHAKNCVPTGWI
jgi:hypothetical protein